MRLTCGQECHTFTNYGCVRKKNINFYIWFKPLHKNEIQIFIKVHCDHVFVCQ